MACTTTTTGPTTITTTSSGVTSTGITYGGGYLQNIGGQLTWTNPQQTYGPSSGYYTAINPTQYWTTDDNFYVRIEHIIDNYFVDLDSCVAIFKTKLNKLKAIESKNYCIFFENDLSSTTTADPSEKMREENSTSLLLSFSSKRNWLELVCQRTTEDINSYSSILYDDNFNLVNKEPFLKEVCTRFLPVVNEKLKSGIANHNSTALMFSDTFDNDIYEGCLPIVHLSTLFFSDYLSPTLKKAIRKYTKNDMGKLLRTELWIADKSFLPDISNECVKEYSYLTLKDNLHFSELKKIFNHSEPTLCGIISLLDQVTKNSIDKISFFVTKITEQLALDQSIKDPEVAAFSYIFSLLSKNIA